MLLLGHSLIELVVLPPANIDHNGLAFLWTLECLWKIVNNKWWMLMSKLKIWSIEAGSASPSQLQWLLGGCLIEKFNLNWNSKSSVLIAVFIKQSNCKHNDIIIETGLTSIFFYIQPIALIGTILLVNSRSNFCLGWSHKVVEIQISQRAMSQRCYSFNNRVWVRHRQFVR